MDSIKHHILKQSSKYLIFGLTSVDFHQPYTRPGKYTYLILAWLKLRYTLLIYIYIVTYRFLVKI